MILFNELEPFAAQWCRNLYPEAHVDERSIADLAEGDLVGFRRVHLFAGVGVWEHALRLAGWPDDAPVWTGSCPCQPFSAAGKRKGTQDERHLWPEMFRLVRECRPPIIFGEQVASPDAMRWLDGVFADLEGEGYACGAADLCAAGVGAPHIRQRLFWVAYAERRPAERRGHDLAAEAKGIEGEARERQRVWDGTGASGTTGGLDDSADRRSPLEEPRQNAWRGGSADGMEHADSGGRSQRRTATETARHGASAESAGGDGGLGDASGNGRNQRRSESGGSVGTSGSGPWSDFELIPCADEKTRRVESGLQCLVDGLAFRLADGRAREDVSRAALLRCIGNSIVPQVAAEFIRAFVG